MSDPETDDCVMILREALEAAREAVRAGEPWEGVVVVTVRTPVQAAEASCVAGRSAFRMVAALDFARHRILRRLDEANELPRVGGSGGAN